MSAVDMQPLRLAIRTVVPTGVDPFGPIEAHPPQVLENRAFRFPRRALEIGVLDADDEGAALPTGEQPVEERRAGIADVQLPGRAGSEAKTHH